MRRLSELLPDAVAALSIADDLAAASREASWESLVEELVPAAAGRSEMVVVRPPEVVVSASDPATAQELRLHGAALLAAFPPGPDGRRISELRVVVRPR
jgi:hypothetical protein